MSLYSYIRTLVTIYGNINRSYSSSSPDVTKIVLESRREDNSEIYIMNAEWVEGIVPHH
jgi:Tol biopolymer transport system component